jgi:fumarate hydratase subunit beta
MEMATVLINILTPITDETILNLSVGDMISISGNIYTGRDAVLPKVVLNREKQV